MDTNKLKATLGADPEDFTDEQLKPLVNHLRSEKDLKVISVETLEELYSELPRPDFLRVRDTVVAWQKQKSTGTEQPRAGGVLDQAAPQVVQVPVPHVTDKPMVITFQKVKAEPKGDKPEAKASKDTKATFDTTPSWSDLCLRVELIFPGMAAEAYSLQCNGMDLSENLWPRAVLPSKPPAGPLQVSLKVIGKCKAFSSFKREDTWQLLHTKMQQVPEREECFPKDDDVPGAALDEELQSVLPIKTQADIIAFVGQELALRCCKTDPRKHSKEVSKRQMISPVIYTAAALAGQGVSVDEERSVCGAYGKGSIDFIIEFDGFDIVVLEGKLHETLDEHLGQLAAGMRSAREQYTRTHLGKRKFDDEGEFEQVPSFGILSNGTTYNFYKYMAQERSLVQFTERANLDKGITAGAAGKAVLPILLRLVKVIKEQMEGMRKFKKASTSGCWSL